MYSATLTRRLAIARFEIPAAAARGRTGRTMEHDAGLVQTEEVFDASVSLPEFGFEDLHIRVEPVYRPLDDRDEQAVCSAVRHYGPGQLPVHFADPKWSFN